jgi:3-hydroxyacyl-[acyl-carrier-protein] dehydratase
LIEREEIKNYIPHRDPFLFVDKVIELEKGSRIVAHRTFEPQEEFFKGHFPGNPIVPGVIIVEALAQAGGVLVYYSFTEELEADGLTGAYLAGLEKVRFRRVVKPGDLIKLDVSIQRKRSRLIRFKATAFVDDAKAAEAEIIVSLY